MIQSFSQMLLEFPKPIKTVERKTTMPLFMPTMPPVGNKPVNKAGMGITILSPQGGVAIAPEIKPSFSRPTWEELFAMAQADEARPQLEVVFCGVPNPDYREDYEPPKDKIPF